MRGPPPLGDPAHTCAWIEPPPALNVTVLPAPAEYFGQVPLMVGSLVGMVAPVSFTPLLEPPFEPLAVPPPLLLSPELLAVPPELLVVPLDPPPRSAPVLPELVLDPFFDPPEVDPLELVPPDELRPISEPLLLPDGAPLSLPPGAGFCIPELLSSPLSPGPEPTPPVAQA